MAAKAIPSDSSQAPVPTDIVCRVVSLYDESAARDPLVRLWDILARKFDGEILFHFSWWKYKFLMDGVMADRAVRDVAEADIITFARHSGGDVPPGLKVFNELWFQQRNKASGLLLVVCDQRLGLAGGKLAFQRHLEEIAKRANLEFWSQYFLTPDARVSDTLEGLMKRANHMSPLLEEMLQRTHPTMHWGINE